MCMILLLLGDKAIEIIESSKATHMDWADYLEKNPAREMDEKHRCLGNAKFHRKCVADYNIAIREIQDMQKKLNI